VSQFAVDLALSMAGGAMLTALLKSVIRCISPTDAISSCSRARKSDGHDASNITRNRRVVKLDGTDHNGFLHDEKPRSIVVNEMRAFLLNQGN
jgi:hypothetical protein